MELLLVKGLCLGGTIFGLFLMTIIPLKCVARPQTDFGQRQRRTSRALGLMSCFAGGVFLATCFLGLLPTVREKVESALTMKDIKVNYPLAETVTIVGLLLSVFVEQVVHTCQKKPQRTSLLKMETLGSSKQTSRLGRSSESDSESESSSDAEQQSLRYSTHNGHLHHDHFEGVGDLSSFRSYVLLLALSVHSVFEGLAMGLQEDMGVFINLYIGVMIHECLAAFALGVNLVSANMKTPTVVKLALLFCVMVPAGMGAGMGIQTQPGFVTAVISAILQGLAAGTFLHVTFFEILGRELEKDGDRLLKVLCLTVGFSILATLAFVLQR
ncbi:PREDICTED: zinc transporter ZIP3-like [Branchiostoma belcheri]|uniref:Zinc transporter ZIP3 n=1 Tax=Branchiostoma belcheri TaxID=7741 RepID=A0A6P4YPI8_BRABE|nr:PREDICTED: zinc transporter ZIP3-like [Branchiostoma belcheri]